jgi:hypothetical protein
MKRYCISLPEETRQRLLELAKLKWVSMSAEIKVLVDAEWERGKIISVGELPRPDDGHPVPVVTTRPAYVTPTVRDITAEVDIEKLRRDDEFTRNACGFGSDPSVIL